MTDDLSNNLNTLRAAAQVKENLTQDLSADQASINKYPSAKAVYDKIALKQDTLTFDTTPTKDSTNPVTSGGVETALGIVREIAEGKCKSYVFNDAATLTDWLTNYADTSTLKTGDIFLIREVNVPDYWWEPVAEDVTLAEYTNKDIIINGKGACRVLETTKVDLTDYALKSDIPITLSELNEDENHRLVTDAEKQAWNAKSNFSGDYKDLNNKPTKLSEFTNDLEGFITQDQVITLIEDYLAGYKLRIVSDENDAGQENYLTIIK